MTNYINWKAIFEAYYNEEPVTCKVIGVVHNGIQLDCFGMMSFLYTKNFTRGVLPSSEAKEIQCKLIKLNPLKNNIILEYAPAEEDILTAESIEVGKFYLGRIKLIQDYGCFVNLGYVDGLLHTNQMPYNNDDWRNYYEVGQEIKVKVISKNLSDPERPKISLSTKLIDEDEWLKTIENFHEDDIVEGTIIKITKNSYIVDLGDNVIGILNYFRTNERTGPSDSYKIGDKITSCIHSFNNKEQKIYLSNLKLNAKYSSDFASTHQIGFKTKVTAQLCKKRYIFVTYEGLPGIIYRDHFYYEDTQAFHEIENGETVIAYLLGHDKRTNRAEFTLYDPTQWKDSILKYPIGNCEIAEVLDIKEKNCILQLSDGMIAYGNTIQFNKKLNHTVKVGEVVEIQIASWVVKESFCLKVKPFVSNESNENNSLLEESITDNEEEVPTILEEIHSDSFEDENNSEELEIIEQPVIISNFEEVETPSSEQSKYSKYIEEEVGFAASLLHFIEERNDSAIATAVENNSGRLIQKFHNDIAKTIGIIKDADDLGFFISALLRANNKSVKKGIIAGLEYVPADSPILNLSSSDIKSIIRMTFINGEKAAQSTKLLFPFRSLLQKEDKDYILNQKTILVSPEAYFAMFQLTSAKVENAIERLIDDCSPASLYSIYEIFDRAKQVPKEYIEDVMNRIPNENGGSLIRSLIYQKVLRKGMTEANQYYLNEIKESGFEAFSKIVAKQESKKRVKAKNLAVELKAPYQAKVECEYVNHYRLRSGSLTFLLPKSFSKKHRVHDTVIVYPVAIKKPWAMSLVSENPMTTTKEIYSIPLVNKNEIVTVSFNKYDNCIIPIVHNCFSKINVRITDYPLDFNYKNKYKAIVTNQINFETYVIKLIGLA